MTTRERPRLWDAFEYAGPVGEGPGGWSVTLTEPDSFSQMKYAFQGRHAGEGPFHVLRHYGRLWMSDTDAEKRDHIEPILMVRKLDRPRVLVHGLGMGLVSAAALRSGASHVDVVEIDAALIEWMKDWLFDEAHRAESSIEFHVADVFDKKWEPGIRWHVVWHDIWPEISEDNREEMSRLHRSFGRRTDWQDSWGKARLDLERRRSYGRSW